MSKPLDSRRQKRKGMIGEYLPDEVLKPIGVYQIEIRDDATGKTLDVVKTNYVTPVWANFAKWVQAMYPWVTHYAVHNSLLSSGSQLWGSAGQPFESRGFHPFAPRPFPWQSIILTDDDAAENTAHHWLRGQVVAWASMWKSAVVPASGYRGQINESECTISADGAVHKKVWDWSTQQGNGEYQTLGIGMMHPPHGVSPLAVLQTAIGPHAIVGPSIDELKTAVAAGALGNSDGAQWTIQSFHVQNDKLIAQLGKSSSEATNQYHRRICIADIPVGFFTSDYDGSGVLLDASGLTWTDISAAASLGNIGGMTTTTSGSIGSSFYGWKRQYLFVAADNDMMWLERWGNPAQGRIGRFDIATKTSVWMKQWSTDYSRATNSGAWPYMAKVGTDIYVAHPSTALSGGPSSEVWNQQLYRINYSDGTLTGLVPMPSGYVIEGGVASDGTDLFVWTNRGIVKMNTAGTILESYGMPIGTYSGLGEFMNTPWPTGSGASNQELFKGELQGVTMWPWAVGETRDTSYINGIRQDFMMHQYTQTRVNAAVNDTANRELQYANGRLWIGNTATPGQPIAGRAYIIGVTGANSVSRALLDSPVTKTSSQTMKVSYELTFPDPDSWIHDHPAV